MASNYKKNRKQPLTPRQQEAEDMLNRAYLRAWTRGWLLARCNGVRPPLTPRMVITVQDRQPENGGE